MKIYEYLCTKDKRNPMFLACYGDLEEAELPPPRVNCFCDNCFYGRDYLALEVLRCHGQVKNAFVEGLLILGEVPTKHHEQFVERLWNSSATKADLEVPGE